MKWCEQIALCGVLTAVITTSLVRTSQGAISVVYANSPTGDDFTNASTTNTNVLTPGAALGSSGWFYNNVRNNGHVGVNTNYPRSGNGSVWFNGTQGPGGNSSKADIEFFNLVGSALTAMGTLGDITSLSYDWYKTSSSPASQHAVLRLYVDADGNLATSTDRGYLVYERAYQTDTSVPTDVWVSDDLLSANLWEVRFGVGNFDTGGNWQPLSVWGSASGFTPSSPAGGLHLDKNSVVFGLSAGIGSGWDSYGGAVDNITIGFGTEQPETTFNFEVQPEAAVPEPATIVVWSMLGVVAGIVAYRRRKS